MRVTTHILILITSFFYCMAFGLTAETSSDEAGERVGSITSGLAEISGICASRRNPGVFWAHNDSGSNGCIYAFDASGAKKATCQLQCNWRNPRTSLTELWTLGASCDLEDIAAATINGVHYLLVGNVGGNTPSHSADLLLFEEPDLKNVNDAQLMNLVASSYTHFLWPTGSLCRIENHSRCRRERLLRNNCEAVALTDEGEIFLITKSGPADMFRLKLNIAPTKNRGASFPVDPDLTRTSLCPLTSVGSRSFGVNPTGMDIYKSPNGQRTMAVLSSSFNCGQIRQYTIPSCAEFDRGTYAPIRTWSETISGQLYSRLKMPQMEGICYGYDPATGSSTNLYVTSERANTLLLVARLPLPSAMTPAPTP